MASSIKGFTLVEVLIAISLLLVLVVGSLSANSLTTTTITLNQRRAEANRLGREAMEAVYAIRAADFLLLTLGDWHPVLDTFGWTLSSGSELIGNSYTRTISLTSIQRDLACTAAVCDIIPGGGITDEGSLLATVTVSWPEAGDTQSIELASLITYWR